MRTHPFHAARAVASAQAAMASEDRVVIERLAENAAKCECLAAWDDTRACICGDNRIEVPLSISAAKRAAQIISQIEGLDYRIEQVREVRSDMIRSSFHPRRQQNPDMFGITISAGNYEPEIGFTIPKGLLLAIMQTERIDLVRQLQETGIVSINLHNIKVRPE